MTSLPTPATCRGHPRTRRTLGTAVLTAMAAVFLWAGPASGTALATPLDSAATNTPTLTASTAAAQPTLRLGSRGSAVTILQRRLAALRYDVGPIDGAFGSSTHHGVVAFQKVNNLARDGVVGPKTWTALDNPATPRPRYSHTGNAVEVNLTKQVLYLTRQGTVVRILDTSTGKASTPTPRGTFSVDRRIDGWRHSSLGWLWRPNYFYRGYAIHGYSSVPTYPASHGCVRVTIPAMNRLWPLLSIGTPVHIYR
jgi:lipoprotein-anchoring transpeptidase ErfK/SrfK